MEAEEKELSKLTKIGTEIIPWKLNDEDQNLVVPNPVGKDLFNGDIKDLPKDKMEEIEKLRPKPVSFPTLALPAPTERLALPAPSKTDPKMSADPDKVFEIASAPVIDIGSIVSKRLTAQRKLQANPDVSFKLVFLNSIFMFVLIEFDEKKFFFLLFYSSRIFKGQRGVKGDV